MKSRMKRIHNNYFPVYKLRIGESCIIEAVEGQSNESLQHAMINLKRNVLLQHNMHIIFTQVRKGAYEVACVAPPAEAPKPAPQPSPAEHTPISIDTQLEDYRAYMSKEATRLMQRDRFYRGVFISAAAMNTAFASNATALEATELYMKQLATWYPPKES